MPYEPTEWIDKTATTPGTKINRQRMMKLEQGVKDAHDLAQSGTSETLITTANYTITQAGDYVATVATTVTLGETSRPLSSGQYVCVRQIGSNLWMSPTGTLTLGGAAPEPDPDETVIVTLGVDDVTFQDQDGTLDDTFTLAAKTGVSWQVTINGGASSTLSAGTHAVTPAGATIAVTANPASSTYELTGQTSWSHEFDTTASPVWDTQVLLDTFTRADGNPVGTQADTGQTWAGSQYWGDIISGTLAPGAGSTHQFIAGSSAASQSLRVKVSIPPTTTPRAAAVRLRGNDTFASEAVDGLGVNLEDRGDGTGRVVLSPAPATMTYNQEGRIEQPGDVVSYWSHIAGWASGTPHTLRVDLLGTDVILYVDDVRILQGVYSAPQLATASGSNVHVWSTPTETAVLDDLELRTP